MTFKDVLVIQDLTGGINSKQRATKIQDNQLVSIENFDFDANSLRRAKGYTKLGTEDDSDLTGKTLYKHEILSGIDVLVKTIGTFIKYYDTVDDEWYKLTLDTFTTGKRWAFASFNGYLYGNNGTDNWIFWNGSARSTLASEITIGATTIDLATGEGARVPTSGTIMIQGDEITYSGKSTDQLTGVSGVGATHAAGSTVILELDASTYSGLEKAKEGKYTIAFHSNRLYYISASNPRKVLHSKLADNTNPETDLINFTVAGSGAGDAGFGFAPDELVNLKQYINGNNSSILATFCKNGNVYAFTVTDGASTTVNVFVPARTMNSYPINSSMVTVAENDLAIVDQFGHCRTLGYGDVNTPLTVKTISQLIEPSLEVTNWDDGCEIYHNRKLYLGGATLEAGTNDIYYYHDSNYTAWGAYTHWDVVDFAEYNAELYGLSAVTGNVFKLNDGYSVYSDSVDDNYEGDYASEAVSKEYHFEQPHKYKQALLLRMDGFITSNAEVNFDIFLDGALFCTFLIDGNDTDILSTIPNVAVGTIVFGQGVFGGGLPGGTTRKEFYVQFALPTLKNFLKAQFRLRMSGRNVDFEMTNLTMFAKELGKELWLNERILTQYIA